jgi:hypothetical protein
MPKHPRNVTSWRVGKILREIEQLSVDELRLLLDKLQLEWFEEPPDAQAALKAPIRPKLGGGSAASPQP